MTRSTRLCKVMAGANACVRSRIGSNLSSGRDTVRIRWLAARRATIDHSVALGDDGVVREIVLLGYYDIRGVHHCIDAATLEAAIDTAKMIEDDECNATNPEYRTARLSL